MRVLHIAPHLGGGVGRFIGNVVRHDAQNQHSFWLLENPIDTDLLSGLNWRLLSYDRQIDAKALEQFDIVQLEFWNHPLFFHFLTSNILPPCRLIIYAHVSGLYPPNLIPEFLFHLSDKLVLSTPAAAPAYKEQIAANKCSVIHELGGISRILNTTKKMHQDTRIVYIGTASYSKIHRGFINACRELLSSNEEVRFLVASNDNNEHLIREAKEFGIDKNFEFLMRVSDIGSILSEADIFGYPLRPDHFGTGEQALLEAMGAGVVPVVLNNPAEQSLIEDGVTGLIANDIYEYVDTLRFCCDNKDYLDRLSHRAREVAIDKFSVNKTTKLFCDLYEEVSLLPRKTRDSRSALSIQNGQAVSGWEYYKLCLGRWPDLERYENATDDLMRNYYRYKLTRNTSLMADNKGGAKCYLKYFPQDPNLLNLVG